nr:RGCVC family protein [Amycolatopsis aidingensis]
MSLLYLSAPARTQTAGSADEQSASGGTATSVVNPNVGASHIPDDEPMDCAACRHPRDLHDQIADRYCAATIAGRFSRGCVCVGKPSPQAR